MKKLDGVIDLNEEYKAIVSFVNKKWELVPGFESLMKKSWDHGLEFFKDSYSQNNIVDKILALDEKTVKYVEDKIKGNLLLKITKLNPETNYGYINKEVKKMVEVDQNFKNIKPFGWDSAVEEHLKNKDSYRLMDIYRIKEEKLDLKLFEGTNINVGQRTFCRNISLGDVVYDEIEQGNIRPVVLIESILLHAGECTKHNNSECLKKEIEKAKNHINSLNEVEKKE